MTVKRCLIMSCSKRKRAGLDFQPAIERYDGTSFRVLRKFLRERPDEANNLDVLVLSAQYGLIPGAYSIPAYDRRMTVERAKELNFAVVSFLKDSMRDKDYAEVFLLVGSNYLLALDGFINLIHPRTKLLQAKGSHGLKASQLKCWLHRTEERKKVPTPQSKIRYSGQALIRGCVIKMNSDQILAYVRESIRKGAEPPARPRSWYVFVDGNQVGPKWIVSLLTGLPLSSFTSGEARRFLGRLGLDVKRNSNGQE